jgi:hypothetical protein
MSATVFGAVPPYLAVMLFDALGKFAKTLGGVSAIIANGDVTYTGSKKVGGSSAAWTRRLCTTVDKHGDSSTTIALRGSVFIASPTSSTHDEGFDAGTILTVIPDVERYDLSALRSAVAAFCPGRYFQFVESVLSLVPMISTSALGRAVVPLAFDGGEGDVESFPETIRTAAIEISESTTIAIAAMARVRVRRRFPGRCLPRMTVLEPVPLPTHEPAASRNMEHVA